MAFWGVEVKPGKPFKLRYEDVNGRLYLAQATLGIGKSTKKSILQCKVGNGKPIFLCTLLPDKIETCPLNLEFEENDVVKFTVIGPTSIHLSGVVRGAEEEGDEDGDEDDFDSDMYGEDIFGTNSEESSYSDSEEDPFGVSEDMFPSPARPSGVVTEEIVDDRSAATQNAKTKLTKGERDQSQGTKDEGKALQIVTKGSTTSPVLQSEDEDGFPVPSSNRSGTGTQKAEGNTDAIKPESASEKMKKEQKKQKKADLGKQDGPGEKSLKRKPDAVVNDESGKSDFIQVNDSSLPTEALPGESMKQKNKKKKKDRGAVEEHVARHEDKSAAKQAEAVRDPDSNGNNDSGAANGSASDEQKKGKKKKKGKSQDSQGAVGDKNTISVVSDKNVSIPEEGAKTPKGKPSKIREYSNGLIIEELEMGKPDGKRASPGKKLKVKYVGKLQKNGQIFDSNINKAPFTFRLGVGAVIKGWDVGVEGMHVGDKRRLTIPPQMGYGAKGAPPKIPPNSWLVFDVELIDVS